MENLHKSSFAVGLGVGIIVSAAIPVALTLVFPSLKQEHRRQQSSTANSRSAASDGRRTPAATRSNTMFSMSAWTGGIYDNSSDLTSDEDYLIQLAQSFRVSTAKLHDLVKHFICELNKGLAAPGQTIAALPSYVTRRPNGLEVGTYLALDLGGTNLRICEVTLEGHGKFRMRQKKFVIKDAIKTGTADLMFDFIASVVSGFLDEYQIAKGREGQEQMQLGFTFSYPVDQTAINAGTLIQWNKGFTVDGVVGKDVVSLLRYALLRKKLNIEVVAIVNDTVGTLISHAYVDTETHVGVILGTGTNAAYVEKINAIPKWKSHYGNNTVDTGEMIVNIEWGAFDNEKIVLPITQYDVELDRASENPGKQIFEKMISGMYLGEISRLVMVDLIHCGILFKSHLPTALAERFRFETQYMSRIERDHSQDLGDTKALLEDMFEVYGTTLFDRQTVKRVCEFVGIRAARLSAAAIAGVVSKMNKLNGCTVAIDGSVFEHYPHFRSRMYDALREVFGMSTDNLHLTLARDGSGVGAALIAAVMGGGEKN